uniref:Centrosome and spindle pole-associated protein 1 n=1 Tax=Magallana gigas TaxID=29159 RepID=A0A8W8KN10_MAGGI
MCAAMVDRNPEYPDYGRPMYDSNPQNDYGRPAYESYQQPGDYRRGQEYGQERYNPTSQYPGSSDPPVKEEQANRHRDEMVRQQHASPPHPANQTEMYDHNQMSQQLREERRKEYNDYLKLKENLEHESAGRPVTPPGGLALGGYEVYRNQLKKDRVREYRQSLLKKEANGTPRAPPTPPVGLNIPTEAERHKIAELKKRQYRDELLRQQKEQILNRAQHQLEIPVIDRRQPNSDPPPLINPPQDRPPSGRWDPQSYRQSNFDQRVTSPPHQANIGHDDYGAFRRQTEHEVRNKEYNDFLAKKQHLEDEKKQKLADQRRQAPAPIVKGDYYDSEQYDRRRQALNDLQHREYQNYLKNHDQQRNRAPTPDHLQGLPLSQRQYDSMRKMQEKQRNQEYNDLLAKKGFNQHQPPETNRRPELGLKSEFQDQEPAGRQSQRNAPVGSLIAGDRVDYPSSANERFNRERRKDYNDYIKKQEADRFRKQENTRPDNRIGFMTHLGRPVEEMREKLAKERHEEYNKYLKDKYISQPHQRPLERPKWVDSKLMEDNWQKEAAGSRSRPTSDKPIHTPTYEEMLDKKRREEASYRRFDDPEYSRSGADRGYDAQYRRYDQ